MIEKLKTKLKSIQPTTWVAVALIVFGVILRILPHDANFAPVGAIALFGGAVLSARHALWLPLVIMIVSDIFIGFHDTMLFTWGGFVLVGMFGMLLRKSSNALRIPVGALGSGLVFFIVSNFGVWVEGRLYPHTLQGLVECYVAALPFLRTSLIADLIFAAVLFGAYALSTKAIARRATLAAK